MNPAEIYGRVKADKERFEESQRLQTEHLRDAMLKLEELMKAEQVRIVPVVSVADAAEVASGILENSGKGKRSHLNVPYVVLPVGGGDDE